MSSNFETIKNEILRRARGANACTEQYSRAYRAETMQELCQVIKDNFRWACDYDVLTVDILEQYKSEFAENELYVNTSVVRGFLLCDNATVKASGNATVEASGNATVRAYGKATVEAYGKATVEAYGNAMVKAYGNAMVKAYDKATVEAYDNAYCSSFKPVECRLSGNALYRVRSTNAVYFANPDIKFQRQIPESEN